MAETVLAFQSQLSGVMETVFKAAMFEITRLVEDSFLEEVTRCREQVDTLKRRLKWSESRRKQREADHQRCVDCGRRGLSSENTRTAAIQTDTNIKDENALPENVSSPQTTDGETPIIASLKSTQSPCIHDKKPRRLLKREDLQVLLENDEKSGNNIDEESGVPGPSNHSSDPKCQLNWEDGFDQRPESEHNSDTDKPADPLLQNRYDMDDLDNFNKTGYEDASMIDMGNMEDSLIYMGQYEDSVKSLEGAENQTYHIDVCKNSSKGSSSKPCIDVSGEFGCLLINEEGYLQDPNILYPENVSVDSGSRINFRDQSNHTGSVNSDCTDNMFEQSNVIPATSHVTEMLQYQSVGKGEMRHTCNLCPASFSDSLSLKAHRQTHKGSGLGPPYSCNQRRKTFTRACNLKERIHSGQGLQLCSFCGRAFPSISELNKHKCGQRGDKPYSCAVCGNKFSRLWNLKLHQRIHTQEKPHHCSVCDKSFTRADILKVHQRTHTGERPYCCLVCGLSFKRLDHLKSHQRKHMTDL